MALSVGDKLGPYEIIAPLGAGGMGEVWKARDTRLDRTVAIKTSQKSFTERFDREARAIAALNHPNICQLYDVGPNYLVMELVEGSPAVPPDSLRKLLDLAVQIADGLAAAHMAGILHRDLKPGNILVTREGRVKILDFGLAKFASARDPRSSVTLTMGITDPGVIVGTVNYMSPEQARGEVNLPPQSDQFSFGLVLYELAGGKRAFQRATAAETMTAIIREEAEPLPATLPAPLRWVIERLLSKEPSERYDSTRDLYRDLKQLRDRLSQTSSSQQAPAAASVAPKRKRRFALASGAALCLAAGSVLTLRLSSPNAAAIDLSNYKFTLLAREDTEKRSPQWSPDGKSICYTARIHGVLQVFTRLVRGAPVQLTRARHDCADPFWSRDGGLVYYVSESDLWSVSAAGGDALKLFEGVTSAALHPDGKTLAFERERKIWLVSLPVGEQKEFWPGPANGGLAFSPDGSKLVTDSIGPLWVLPYPNGTPQKLNVPGVLTTPSWFPDNRRLAVASRTRETDRTTLSVIDTADGIRRTIAAGTGGFASPSVSPDGKSIAYTTSEFEWDVLEISIPNGEVHTVISGGISRMPDWAPSGTHFVYAIPAGDDVGIMDRQAGSDGFSRRLIDIRGNDPQWSPQGDRLVYHSEINATGSISIANASGSGSVVLDSAAGGVLRGMSWSPDGQWISYTREISGKVGLAKIRTTPGSAPETLPGAKPQTRRDSVTLWSPTGEWIAYPAASGIDLISPDGKSNHNLTPRKFLAYSFSKDGAQLYGILQDTSDSGAQWQLFSINVKTGAERFLAPIDLPASVGRIAGFSIHPDGKRFLTSAAKFPYNIWMLEGFEQPQPGGWFTRLLHP